MTILAQSAERRSMEQALHALREIEDCDAANQDLREKLLSLEEKLEVNQLNLAVLA
jgi:hypothetical protein